MTKVLIIGGAGFIGLNLTRQICKQGGYHITILDNFFRGKHDDQMASLVKRNSIHIIQGDCTDKAIFKKLASDYDQVYMLASVVGVNYTMEMPHEIIRINTSLILNTLEWLKSSQCKKVLFTSTSECYAGAIDAFDYRVPTDEEVPLCIGDISHPRFTYAVTKMLGESAFLNYSRMFDFDTTIIRYHNVYGPRMGFKHVIPQVVQRFFNHESPFKIYGFDQTRAFNYVDDAVRGTIQAMESEKANGEIFHIGDDRSEITIEELVRYIGQICGYQGEYAYGEQHSGSVNRRCPDIGKARKILNYSPTVDWTLGVEQTVKWYLEYYNTGKHVFE